MVLFNVCRKAAMLAALFVVAGNVNAQEIQFQPTQDSPIGSHNESGPDELAQYAFLAGDWDVVVTMPQPNKDPFVYQAKWHNHWVVNGYVMMQEWRGPYSTGTEIRSFNPTTKKWDGRNLYVPSPGTWYENEAEMVGDEMIVTTQRKDEQGNPVLNREVYHEIQKDSFRIRTEVSSDNGATWQAGRYSLKATRIGQ